MSDTSVNSIAFPNLKDKLTIEEAAQLRAAIAVMDAMNSQLSTTPKRDRYFLRTDEPYSPNVKEIQEPRTIDLPVIGAELPSKQDSVLPLVIRKRSGCKAPATIQHSATDQPRPQLDIHSFVLTSFLGGGSQGKVYKALYKNKPTTYAVKVVPRQNLRDYEVERVLREQSVLTKLKGVPFIMDISASFHDSANFYIVSPHYGGGDLQALLLSWTCFPLERTVFYTAEIVLGLQFIHQRGICHRDLKLSNILLTSDGHVVLADFGLSSDESYLEMKPSFCGTATFMAPEVLQRRSLPGKASDVWSLGICIWLMRSGKLPWWIPNDTPATKKAIAEDPLPSVQEYEGGFEEEVHDLCKQILVKDKNARPTLGVVSQHAFFSGLDWNGIAQRSAEAPWLPEQDDENPAFAAELLKKHKLEYPTINKTSQDFPGFSYYTPEFPLDLDHIQDTLSISPFPHISPLPSPSSRSAKEEQFSRSLTTSPSLRLALFKFPLPQLGSAARKMKYKVVECSDFSSDSDTSTRHSISHLMRVRCSSTSHQSGDCPTPTTNDSSSPSSSSQGLTEDTPIDHDHPSGPPKFVRWLVRACKMLLSYRIRSS